ncbi:pre-mRNA splicing regulator USH1G-like [Antedon mediterranea]|uniref:pre-mRNA splicing regulator USH1G-like n=1 Tax=Antedon mediterranea TaxID=105859 RepID=UPI003AF5C751
MAAEKFHIAAKNGSLDVLSEATRKDCNKLDENGMTPTLWAAVKGNVDTLRVIVSRGGDPRKCDFQGNTCLHWAAAGGHLNAITFLVSFDCSIWAMNNDHQTPMDVAAEKNRRRCVDFLDDISSKKSASNPKLVKKLKLEAMKEADKRAKKFFEMQAKMQKEIERRESKENAVYDSKKPGSKSSSSTVGKKASKRQGGKGTFSSTTGGPSGGTIRSQRDFSENDPIPDETELTPESEQSNALLMVTDQYAVNAMTSLPTGEVARVATPDDDLLNGFNDLDFEKNGIGTRRESNNEINPKLGPRGYIDPSPWDVDLDDLDDDVDNDDNDNTGNSLLGVFLAANGLQDYLMVFNREDIDLDALTLLIDDDLSTLGIPMGPRRKLLQAVSKRRMVMEFPGTMGDSEL